MPNQVTIQDLYNSLHDRLDLHWVAGESGSTRILIHPDEHPDSRIIVGSLNLIHPSRIQLIGPAEKHYLESLSDTARNEAIDQLMNSAPAAIVLVNGVMLDINLEQKAEKAEIPLMRTSLADSLVLDNLQYFAYTLLSEKKILHGVYLEVLGMGVLLTGNAAVGKSELALELITRGNRLIADDAPEFSLAAPDIVTGTCPPMLRNYLEVRGLGIINIRKMFGDSAIKNTKYLKLIVNLQRMRSDEIASMDRLSGTHTFTEVLNVPIPTITVPVAPGRNLAILVEAAVRNHLLRLKGYDATEEFAARQQRAIMNQ